MISGLDKLRSAIIAFSPGTDACQRKYAMCFFGYLHPDGKTHTLNIFVILLLLQEQLSNYSSYHQGIVT